MIDQKKKEKLRKIERDKYTSWYYENEYWKEDNPNAQNDRYQYNDSDHSKRFNFLTHLITSNFEFSTFLDAGCGMGHLIKNLIKKGYTAKGVEVSKDALKEYLSDLTPHTVLEAGVENLPFQDNSFDIVMCLDVMEHVPPFDVEEAISELIRVAKSYIVLTINLDNPYEYHPSMFTRDEWEKMFLKNKNISQSHKIQESVEKQCKQRYPEYDFFIFKKG